MEIVVNKITNVILGINVANVPASYVIQVPDNFNFTKTMNELEYTREYVTPAMIASGQFKPSDLNKPLFTDGSGNLTTDPTGNKPALTTITVPVTYDFVDNPTKFTVDDVIVGKANFLVTQDMYKYMVLDEAISFASIDQLNSVNINLGVKDIELMVGGVCRTNAIALSAPTKIFSSYIESTSGILFDLGYLDSNNNLVWLDFTNVPLILPDAVTTVYLRFTNTSSTDIQHVNCYGILF